MIRLLFLALLCLGCQSNASSNKYDKIISTIDFAKYNASTNIIIFVNYKIPSNKDRMFVYDINQHKIIYSCWCAHGFGGGSTASIPRFSNTLGSNCSSLGLFAIDKWEGTSATYGYKYHSLEGLSITNSNARKRQLLIHSWRSVTNDYYNKITKPMNCDYRSAGCFTTTSFSYNVLHKLISKESKKVLLYSYY